MKNLKHKKICTALRLFSAAILLTNLISSPNAQIKTKDEIDITADDSAKAAMRENYLSSSKLDSIQGRHLDGARGVNFISNPPVPPFNPRAPDPQLEVLKYYACKAAAFGEYKLINQRSFVGDGGNFIYTKRRFKLVDDWSIRDEPTLDVLDVVMRGGEVIWKGEKIRLENEKQKFKVGRNYIVAVGVRTPTQKKLIFGEMLFLEVDNGSIYPGDSFELFEAGTKTADVKKKLNESITSSECLK